MQLGLLLDGTLCSMQRSSFYRKEQHVTMTKTTWLMLFKKMIAFYSENETKPINTLCGQNGELQIVHAGGTYSYHWALKS
jgi:hypothetical protein